MWLAGILFAGLGLFLLGFYLFQSRSNKPREAPEAELVLQAQVQMPFQVLIPAYLPKNFIREKTQVNINKPGPQGEPMVEIIYQNRKGDNLYFYEWLPDEQATEGRKSVYCMCECRSQADCDSVEMGIKVDALRVVARVSAPNILSSEEARSVLDTLGPAVNRQVYSSLKEVPVTYSVSPAVDIPINASGVQEVTLIVTPNGYSPEHFAVKKDIPVRLTFRQLGQVGCGNELIFEWGDGESATIVLASPTDSQTLEFTPGEVGEFRFNCPHLIFRGVMTVRD